MKVTVLQSTLLLSLASVAFSSPLSYDNAYGHTTKVSTDRSCGGATGYTCAGSQWGNCCSPRGHCGNTADYCKAGCQSEYGKCGDAEIVKPNPSYEKKPSYGKPSPPVSKDGRCGKMNGKTCLGSVFGECCSQLGNCGSTSAFCEYNCQAGYGKCGEVEKSSSTTLKKTTTCTESSTTVPKVYATESAYAEKPAYGYKQSSSSVAKPYVTESYGAPAYGYGKSSSAAKPYASESPYGGSAYGYGKSSSAVKPYASESPYGAPAHGYGKSSSAVKPYASESPYGAPAHGYGKSSSAVKPYASESPYGAPAYGQKSSSVVKPYASDSPYAAESPYGYNKASTPVAKPYATESSYAESAYGAKGYTPVAKPYASESAHGYAKSSTTVAKPYVTESPYGPKTPFDRPVVPVCNAEVNKSDLKHLVPSYSATLNYKEAGEGDYAVSLKYKMKSPQVTLENSAYVSNLVCSGDSMSLSFKNRDAYAAAEKWPRNQLILITDKAGCNPSNERGAYLLVNHECDEKTLTMTCKVKSQKWKDIAEWVQPSYGHIASGKTYATAYTTAATSTFPCESSTLAETTSTSSKVGYAPYSAPSSTTTLAQYSSIPGGYGYGASTPVISSTTETAAVSTSVVESCSTTFPAKSTTTSYPVITESFGFPYEAATTSYPVATESFPVESAAASSTHEAVPTTSALPSYCPPGYAAGSVVRGGVTYHMTCGETIDYTGVSIGSAGPPSGINNMGDCMDWCNRHGGYCKVAIWDSTQHYSCRLLSSGSGATSYCSTAAFATRP